MFNSHFTTLFTFSESNNDAARVWLLPLLLLASSINFSPTNVCEWEICALMIKEELGEAPLEAFTCIPLTHWNNEHEELHQIKKREFLKQIALLIKSSFLLLLELNCAVAMRFVLFNTSGFLEENRKFHQRIISEFSRRWKAVKLIVFPLFFCVFETDSWSLRTCENK